MRTLEDALIHAAGWREYEAQGGKLVGIDGETADWRRDLVLLADELRRLQIEGGKMTEEEIRRDERTRCWQAINQWVQLGDLSGNGTDKTAERNGLILAANEITMRGVNFGEEARYGIPFDKLLEADLTE